VPGVVPRRASRTVEMPIFVRAPPKTVFRALTSPEILRHWFMDRATLEPRKGGRYAFEWTGGPTHTGTVLEFVRDRRITLGWQWPGQERLGTTRLRISVAPKAGGTVVTFAHSGFGTGGPWQDLYEGAIRGWTYFLMNLKSVVENGHDLRSPYDW